MAIRITLEYGHASMVRSHLTPEGYTHDWEVFVRGVDNADIHQYIDKVVFLLHDSFRNPKRVLKEPPFVVKESGYAGFLIPIEIYLKNKDEPKKFQISYDLDLQQSGPPINNVLRHMEVISNPSEEFRKKLLKGGGVVVSTRDSLVEKSDVKTSGMIGKPKLSSDSRKHRITESKTSNSFHELFGPPIKTAKISPDNKKVVQPDKNSVPKPLSVTEKSDKMDKLIKKDNPHKDSRKDKVDEKKDKKVRDSTKDKVKSKDKPKKPTSPGNKSHSSPSSKRPASPVLTKKSSSPLPTSLKRPPSPKPKEKDPKKIVADKEKDSKEKDKAKNNSKNIIDSSKSEKKKDKKKDKEDRDKEKKDKYKETEKANIKDLSKIIEKKPEKTDKVEKPEKEKLQEYKSSRDGRRSPKPVKENDKVRDDKVIKVDKSEKSERPEKLKDGKSDKDRQKHKHKKKDKKDKRDSNKDREKKEKRDKSKDGNEKPNNVSATPLGNPLSTLLAEIPERDSSDSTPSVDDDAMSESKPLLVPKKETEHAVMPTIHAEAAKPLSPGMSMEVKKEKSDRSRKDKSKRSRSEERESRKKKRRSESKGDDKVKREKSERDQSTSPPLEPVSSSQSPVVIDVDPVHHAEKETRKELKKEKDDRESQTIKDEKNMEVDAEQVAPDSTNTSLVDTELSEPPVFSEDYVSQLKDLQQKIMTLQDNQELQRVVQVIAETGQYEITKKTFDFDLCALDRRTVQRLQQFFSAS
ncbi:protein AF-9 [Harpegnathos saltator]|uniref:Protein ENL n=1 Tax=Harpegnathos saltator TaxID=610380 RepID=E2C126_HARSA|nr:protein AF-9 [Harpegnathos saltator]XP_011148745.1 protein AF-9 [Harpegnathos saltator]EFN78347.1 Protein ENL [Harpegnathos saltator]